MARTQIPNPQTLKEFVDEQLEQGHYESYEEMVTAGLQLLKEQAEEYARIADELKPGIEWFRNGNQGFEVDFEEIKAEGRRKLAQKGTTS